MSINSVYLRLADYCNMACGHCCFGHYRGQKGKQMSKDLALTMINWAFNNTCHVTLGGGEPTLNREFRGIVSASLTHPRIEDFVDATGIYALSVITNGKRTADALWLARQFNKNVEKYGRDKATLSVRLSQDDYHEDIDPEVVEAFKGQYNKLGRVSPHGNAKDWGTSFSIIECCCDAMFVTPQGDVFVCGCMNEKITNVLTEQDWEEKLEAHKEYADSLDSCCSSMQNAQNAEPLLRKWIADNSQNMPSDIPFTLSRRDGTDDENDRYYFQLTIEGETFESHYSYGEAMQQAENWHNSRRKMTCTKVEV